MTSPSPLSPTPSIDSRFGSQLLFRASTGLERALADIDAARITEIPAELIRDIWDPDRCPLDLLTYLAWAFGVEFWNDGWREVTKREWIKNQLIFKSERGTEGGLRMAVDYAGRDVSRWGYNVDKVTTRPVQVFSGPSLTKAQREAWLTNLPQVRAWRIREEGSTSQFKSFYGASNSLRQRGRNFIIGGTWSPRSPGPDTVVVASTPSTAIQRLKRRVRWVENGIETDVTVTEFGSYFRIHRRSIEDHKVFCGRPFNLGRYFIPSDAWKRLLTVQPREQMPWRTAMTPSLQAITSEPERIVESGVRDHKAFCDVPGNQYYVPSTAKYRIYQRFAVLDPSVREYRANPVQFMGTGRYGFPPFTAWADVRVGNVLSRWAAGFGYYGERRYYIPHNDNPLKQVRLAAVASKSLRDKILLRIGPKPRFVAGGTPVLAGINNVIVGQP